MSPSKSKAMSSVEDQIAAYLERSLSALASLSARDLARIVERLRAARESEAQIFVCGNGGSASTASHFAVDLGKGASLGKPRRFRVLALTDNIAWITALGNDLDYSEIFVEQLKNYARAGDLLLAISASGNSPNVLRAVDWARQQGLDTIGLTGESGGRLAGLVDLAIRVSSTHIGHVEEGHFLIQHILAYTFMESE